MKRYYKVFSVVLVLVFLFAGCKKGTSGQIFRYDITANPTTFDPQLADSNEELMIVENSFEGLLRRGEDGELLPGVAQRWEVSPDKKTYTFYLRQDAKWSDKETPVTAHDFVFALRRLLDPQTSAPSAQSFLCLQNASGVLSGELSPEQVGVQAQDDFTLIIRLDYANPLFEELLTSAAAMPCNEKFFQEQKGKYGVTIKNSLFNGPFAVTTWDPQKYVVLRTNQGYQSESPSVAGGMTLYLQDDTANTTQRLLNGDTDLAPLTFEEVGQLQDRVQVHQFEDTVWSIQFNPENSLFQNSSLRRGIAHSLDLSELNGSMVQNEQTAFGIVPSAVTLSGNSYRELAADQLKSAFNEQAALEQFRSGLSQLELSRLPKVTLLVPNQSNLPLLAGMLQEQWQNRLGAYINLESLPMEEFKSRISSKDYDMALIPMSATYNSPTSVLENFTGEDALWAGSDRTIFAQLLQEASLAGSMEEMVNSYVRAEQMILDLAPAIPVFFETSYYGVGKQVQQVILSPFSYRAFFKYAQKPAE